MKWIQKSRAYEVISSKFLFEKKSCFVKSPIELAVKICKNTCNFTSGLKPASLVRDEFCQNFYDSFHYSYFLWNTFWWLGGFLSEKKLLLGNFEEWSARKYIAFINDFKACVYHYCYHTCQAKGSSKDLAESGKSYNNKSNNKIFRNSILVQWYVPNATRFIRKHHKKSCSHLSPPSAPYMVQVNMNYFEDLRLF